MPKGRLIALNLNTSSLKQDKGFLLRLHLPFPSLPPETTFFLATLTCNVIDSTVDDYRPRFDPLPFHHFRLTSCDHQDVTFTYLGKDGSDFRNLTVTHKKNVDAERTPLKFYTTFFVICYFMQAAHSL